MLQKTNPSIVSIEIFLPYNHEDTTENYRFLLRRFPRITRFVIHSANENRYFNDPQHFLDLIALNYTTQKITDETHCGVVHPGYFSTAIDHFTEAQQHNTCLNRKISIDKKGQICNCPSMTQKFGNVKEITLDEAINQPDFKKNWTINKDQIETCKACEFRYICSDCRAYTKDNQPLEKPAKCGYDPYSGEWC
jgi:SPASM domain peptide maturase of grasp-with-spasm system